METKALQTVSPQQNQLITLTTLPMRDIIKTIMLSKHAGQNSYGNEDWLFVATEIKKDFPKMTLEKLQAAMMKGIKGLKGDDRFINMRVIYDWIYSENSKDDRWETGAF